MKIIVAGQDRSAGLGGELETALASRNDQGLGRRFADEGDVKALGAAADTADYLDRHLKLLRSRNCVDLNAFSFPRGRGPGGRLAHLLRRFLWKLLRYQHDWTVFQQNAVNVQVAAGMEFEAEERRKRVAELEQRISRLEQGRETGAPAR
jgi:hypothetical protein